MFLNIGPGGHVVSSRLRRYGPIALTIILIALIAISLATALKLKEKPSSFRDLVHAHNDVELKDGEPNSGTNEDEEVAKLQAQQNATISSSQQRTGDSSKDLGTKITSSTLATTTSLQIAAATTISQKSSALQEGFIGASVPSSAQPAPNPIAWASSIAMALAPSAIASVDTPIIALSYSLAPGPKRCRGHVVHSLHVPRPASQWRDGVCVTLPHQAECGVFYARKEDNCEARLHSVEGCANGTETYVNTVVFTEEKTPKGGIWRSMLVRCGIDVPIVPQLDAAAMGLDIKDNSKGG